MSTPANLSAIIQLVVITVTFISTTAVLIYKLNLLYTFKQEISEDLKETTRKLSETQAQLNIIKVEVEHYNELAKEIKNLSASVHEMAKNVVAIQSNINWLMNKHDPL